MSYVTKFYEHSYYVGNFLSGILYGVELCVYFLTIKALHKNRTRKSGFKNTFFLIYTTILFVLLTIHLSTNAYWAQMMWITGPTLDTSGKGLGAITWARRHTTVWYHRILGPCAFAWMIFLGDALLIWRLFVVFGSKWYVIVLPCLIYIASFVLAILEFLSRIIPSFLASSPAILGVPYYALSIGMNIVTVLICVRLWIVSIKTKKLFGDETAKTYKNIITILIESAMPYSLVGIMFLISYAKGSEVYILFQQLWAVLACLSPQFIILRVATGKAWKSESASNKPSSIVFQSSGSPHVTYQTGSGRSGDEEVIQQVSRYGRERSGDSPV